MKSKNKSTKTYTHPPFTWKRADDGPKEEAWDLIRPFAGATYFCIKNYGGPPRPGFAGWKLVSGGPFDDAGAYTCFLDAVQGVTPYLVRYFKQEAKKQKRNE